MAQNISRKLTIATVTGAPAKWFKRVMEADGKVVKLCSIYGITTGYIAGATEYGEFLKFRGNFRGVNTETGEIQNAPQVILPTHIGEMLRAQLEGGAQSVQFAFDIGARFDASSLTKYVYELASTLPAAENDPLAAIELAIAEQLKLEAPTQAPSPATAPAAKSAATNSRRR